MYWDKRFYFYNVRKALVANLVSELGYNVLQTDTDVAWLADPYPFLHAIAAHAGDAFEPSREGQSAAWHSAREAVDGPAAAVDRPAVLISQGDSPFLNAGVFYFTGVRRTDGAAWVAREVAERVHAFMTSPTATVRTHVPWAVEPYFANSDEQTIMNDVVMGSVVGERSFASTAVWEAKRGGSQRIQITSVHADAPVQADNGTVAAAAKARARPAIELAQGEMDRLIQATLMRQRSLPSASETGLSALMASRLCEREASVAADEVIAAAPLAAQSGSRRALKSSRASWVHAPGWLFAHYPARYKPWRPTDVPSASGGGRRCVYSSDGDPTSRAGPPPKPSAVMLHMAGVRSGSWHRRALMRAHGWWDPRSDALLTDELGWGRRGGGPLLISRVLSQGGGAIGAGEASRTSSSGSPTSVAAHALALLPTPTPAESDTLAAGLLLLAALTNRTLVIPEVACPHTPAEQQMWLSSPSNELSERLVRVDGTADRCVWTPPPRGVCKTAEYVTASEFVRAWAGSGEANGSVPGWRRRQSKAEEVEEEVGLRATGAVAPLATSRRLDAMRKTRPQDATTLVRGSGIGRTAQPEHSEGEEEKARERRRSSKTCVDMVRLLGGDDTRGMDPEAEELHAADGRNADEARAPPAADADADAGDVDADTDASERAAGERQSRLKRVQWHSAGNGWLEQGSALARLLHVIICGEDDEGGQDSEITEASGGGGGGGSDGRGGGVGGDGDGDDTEAGRATVGHPTPGSQVRLERSLDDGSPLRLLIEEMAQLERAAAWLREQSVAGSNLDGRLTTATCTQELLAQSKAHQEAESEVERRHRRRRGRGQGGNALLPF